MSSATSINELPPKGGSHKGAGVLPAKVLPPKGGSHANAADGPTPADQGFRPWHFFVLASLTASTAAVVLSRQSAPEHLILISLTIGAAGAAAAALYRTIVPFTMRDVSRLAERPSDRARSALEREKTLVLRSIKELEFDRAMGKVSEKDFDEMAGRLRSRAMTLMKQLDAGGSGYREVIERELSARLQTGHMAHAQPDHHPAGSSDRTADEKDAPVPSSRSCRSCETVNDPDAVFCKRCGTALATVQ
jgi:hypothetical protein